LAYGAGSCCGFQFCVPACMCTCRCGTSMARLDSCSYLATTTVCTLHILSLGKHSDVMACMCTHRRGTSTGRLHSSMAPPTSPPVYGASIQPLQVQVSLSIDLAARFELLWNLVIHSTLQSRTFFAYLHLSPITNNSRVGPNSIYTQYICPIKC